MGMSKAAVRGQAPVVFSTFAQGYWVFTSYEPVRELYQNDKLYSAGGMDARNS
jgi:hypothetical protein